MYEHRRASVVRVRGMLGLNCSIARGRPGKGFSQHFKTPPPRVMGAQSKKNAHVRQLRGDQALEPAGTFLSVRLSCHNRSGAVWREIADCILRFRQAVKPVR